MRTNTATALVPAGGKAPAPDTKPHSTLLPYVGVAPYSNEQELTPAALGFTNAYSAADVRVTSDAASVAAVGAIGCTAKLTGALVPVGFWIELGCVATAVYSPHASAGLALAETHLPPRASAVAEATTAPSGRAPAYTSTVTGVRSLAVPENEGTRLADGDTGSLIVTVGDDVS